MYMHTMRLDARPGHEEALRDALVELVENPPADGPRIAHVGQVEWARGEFFVVELYDRPSATPLHQRHDVARRLLEHVESSFRYVESTVVAHALERDLATPDLA